jgi:hypothetical protein
MFGFFQRWRQSSREWHHGQTEIWPSVLGVGPDGLSLFQHEASQLLIKSLGPIQLQQAGTTDLYLTGKLPGTEAIVFIYADGAQIHVGPKAVFLAEREDYARPQELLQQFIAAAQGVAT